MPAIRKSHPKVTPASLRAAKALAVKLDAEESQEIKARGREVFDRRERITAIIHRLKAARRRRGLTLDEVSNRSGIAKPNLSRLENSTTAEPTFETLDRYAKAVGMALKMSLEKLRRECPR